MRGDAAHHIGQVLRAQVGQLYELSDGRQVRLGRIAAATRDRIEFELLEEVAAYEPRVAITLLLSVVKFDAFEWALEKGTELGVARVVPLAAARSEKKLVQAAGKRAARWEKILLEAAQQSRRVRVSRLEAVQKPEAAFRAANEHLKLMLSERTDAPAIRNVLELASKAKTQVQTANLGHPANPHHEKLSKHPQNQDPGSENAPGAPEISSVVVAIGPEGGWSDEEFDSAERAGFQSVSLGRLILRVETAVTAALTIVNYALEGEE